MNSSWKAAATLTPAAILMAVAVAYGAVTPRDNSSKVSAPSEQTETPAERFADAPHGVDAIVTGPVSDTFRQQQEALDCDQARWPDIPAACYPDMKTNN